MPPSNPALGVSYLWHPPCLSCGHPSRPSLCSQRGAAQRTALLRPPAQLALPNLPTKRRPRPRASSSRRSAPSHPTRTLRRLQDRRRAGSRVESSANLRVHLALILGVLWPPSSPVPSPWAQASGLSSGSLGRSVKPHTPPHHVHTTCPCHLSCQVTARAEMSWGGKPTTSSP